MLKNILNIEGAQHLSNDEQKAIKGGKIPPCCLEWNPVTRQCLLWDEVCLQG